MNKFYVDEHTKPNNISFLILLTINKANLQAIGKTGPRMVATIHATARDYNRVASFGVNVLTIRRDSTGQKVKCSESEKLVKTGRL